MSFVNKEFKIIQTIGSGAYGEILLVEDFKDSKICYLNSLCTELILQLQGKSKFQKRLNILILQRFSKELKEIFIQQKFIYLKMNYFDTDLAKLIMCPSIHFDKDIRKNILYQITKALAFLSANFVLHRDMKPSNILVNKQGQLVLTDFGLARHLVYKDKELSKGVVTRWYRSPEILFGARFYSDKIDMWSLGCIFAELFLKQPLFPGDSDMVQLSKIFGVLGTPNSQNWPQIEKLPNFLSFSKTNPINLHNLIPEATQQEIFLIQEMLNLDPNKRISIQELLNHEYFQGAENFDQQKLGNLISKLQVNQYLQFKRNQQQNFLVCKKLKKINKNQKKKSINKQFENNKE